MLSKISSGDFGNHISEKAYAKRIPLIGGLEITHRCNLNCLHCYQKSPSVNRKEEIAFEKICDILNQISVEGCLFLGLTGGEPLIRKDFLDIYTYVIERGFLTILATNGTLITPSLADHLKEYRPFYVEISLFGASKNTYESITGVSGSYERCIKGINLISERNIPLLLRTPLMSINKKEIRKIKDFSKHIGAKFSFDRIIIPRLNGSKDPCSLRVTPQEIIEFEVEDDKILKGYNDSWQKRTSQVSDLLYNCDGGRTFFRISPDGKLMLCPIKRFPMYDLMKGNFKEGWNNCFTDILSQKHSQGYKCSECPYISICDICPAKSQLENGNQESPIMYFCQIAKLRASYLGNLKQQGELKHKII